MKLKEINFVREFTDTPGGRYRKEGPFSGEDFRERILCPALKENETVRLDLNGAFGLPASFIDEAFGILVEKFGYEFVNQKLVVVLNDNRLASLSIDKVMRDHARVSPKNKP